MSWLIEVSNWMIPAVFVSIILYGIEKRAAVFDCFVSGVTEGFSVVFEILPTFLGLMVAVGAMRASGAMELLGNLLAPVGECIRMPVEVITIALTKMVSSSAATGLVLDLLETYGPDSLEGRMTGIMLGSTETILYTMSVYFMAVRIKRTRYTLAGAIIANIAGILASVWLTYRIFYGS